MPSDTSSSASAPFSYELLADLRADELDALLRRALGSSACSALMTRSESCALDTPSLSGSRISACRELPKLCTENSPRLELVDRRRARGSKSAACA